MSKVEERFWNKVTLDQHSGCSLWTGTTLKGRGYGLFTLSPGQRVYAHRFAYEQIFGPIPFDLEIDHLCRNPRCVNPCHLEAVPHAINIKRSPIMGAKKKSHCKYGHPLSGENIYITPRGDRQCRACHRYWVVKSRADHRKKEHEKYGQRA